MKIQDAAQSRLDLAAANYREKYNRGFLAQQQGDYDKGQRILEKANKEYNAAKREFERTTGRRA